MADAQPGQSPEQTQWNEALAEATRASTGRTRTPIRPVYGEIVAANGSHPDRAINNVVSQLAKTGGVVVADERSLQARSHRWPEVAGAGDEQAMTAARADAAGMAAELGAHAREEGLHYVRVTDGANHQPVEAQREKFQEAGGYEFQQLTVMTSTDVGYVTDLEQDLNRAASAHSGQDGSFQPPNVRGLDDYKAHLQGVADKAMTPGVGDHPFTKSGVVADGRKQPFDKVLSVEQGEKRGAQGSLLSDAAANMAEQNPQKRLGVYGKDGRYVQAGVEQLREVGGLQHHPDVRQLAQDYSGSNEAKAAWGPQKSGVVGKATEAVASVGDALSGASGKGHKAPQKVNLDAVKQVQQPKGRGV